MSEPTVAPARQWYDLLIEVASLRGWTKVEISERSGVARTTIDGWQRNPGTPQARSVNAVADVLGIPRRQALCAAGILPDPAEAQ